MQELKRLVNEYAKIENTKDQSEWQLVLKEALSFLEVSYSMSCRLESFTGLAKNSCTLRNIGSC